MNQIPETGLRLLLKHTPEVGILLDIGMNQIPETGLRPRLGYEQPSNISIGMNQIPETGLRQFYSGVVLNLYRHNIGMNQIPETGLRPATLVTDQVVAQTESE